MKHNPQSALKVPIFNCIDLHPSPIKHISTSANKVFVSRTTCSQVYSYVHASDLHKAALEQVLRLEPSQKLLEIDGFLVMIKPFELKVYDETKGAWAIYPFTTQFCSSLFQSNELFTFHEKESLRWSISQETGVHSRFLQKGEAPYHVNYQGELQGFGKKVRPALKFTVSELSHCSKYLFIGDEQGGLSIYETQFLTHLKRYRRHEAAILAIKATSHCVYFTGSDSKISSLTLTKSEQGIESWNLSSEVRAQSHDIFSLETLKISDSDREYLISGGVTTDLCLYTLQEGVLGEEWAHKIAYSSQKLVECVDEYFFVNKFNSFEIWKVQPDEPQDSRNLQLLVRYDLPAHKHIQQLAVTPFQNRISEVEVAQTSQYLVMLATQHEAISWLFSEEIGLTKFSTISNAYTLVRPMGGESLLTLRDGNKLEKLELKTGRIRELVQVQVPLATDLFLHYNGSEKWVLVASRYSGRVEVYSHTKGKGYKLQTKLDLQTPYNLIDICYYNPEHFLLKLSHENTIKELDRKGSIIRQVIKLPIKKVRQHGWAQVLLQERRKVYWYLVSDAKIVIVSGMKKQGQKKVRVKQMPRIGNVVGNPLALSALHLNEREDNQAQRWSLGVVALDMGKMIARQPIQPVVAKKIL